MTFDYPSRSASYCRPLVRDAVVKDTTERPSLRSSFSTCKSLLNSDHLPSSLHIHSRAEIGEVPAASSPSLRQSRISFYFCHVERALFPMIISFFFLILEE